MISQLLGASGSLIGAGLNAAGSRAQFNRQRQLQNESFSYNSAMWDKQNYYNSYESQISRMKQAGLNPRLMYSNGTGSDTAGTPPTHSPAESQNYSSKALEGLSVQSSVLDLLAKSEQLKGIREDNKIKAADAVMKDADARYYVGDGVIDMNGLLQGSGAWNKWMTSVFNTNQRRQEYHSYPSIQQSSIDLRDSQSRYYNTLQGTLPSLIQLRQSQADSLGYLNSLRRSQTRLHDMEYDWFNANSISRILGPFLKFLR